jgi:hypothetical protein
MRSTRRRLLTVVAVAVGLLLVAEAGVRLSSSRLPTPQLWSGPEMPVKEEQIDELAAHGGASVVFMGSSTMDAAADASAFHINGATRPLYNGSTGAGSMSMIDIWGRLVAVPRLHPDVIVLGLVSRELNPNDREQALINTNFMRSKAVRRLLGTETLLERVERHAEAASDLVNYRSVLRQPRRVWDTLRTGEFLSGEFGEIVAADGQYQGFLERHVQDSGVTTASLRQTALRDFEIGDQQVRTLRKMLDAFTGQGIQVVVVNMPVARVYVDAHPHGKAGYLEAVDVVREEAVRAGAEFIDLGQWPDALMADMGHVNATGVRRFTEEITPVIAAALDDHG